MPGLLPQEGGTLLPGFAQGPVTNYTQPLTQPHRPLDSVDLARRNILNIFPTLQAPLSPLIFPDPVKSEADAVHVCLR